MVLIEQKDISMKGIVCVKKISATTQSNVIATCSQLYQASWSNKSLSFIIVHEPNGLTKKNKLKPWQQLTGKGVGLP